MANIRLERLCYVPVMAYRTTTAVASCFLAIRKVCTAGGRIQNMHAIFGLRAILTQEKASQWHKVLLRLPLEAYL